MKSLPRDVLCDLLRQYGRDLATDLRVKGLLLDLCSNCRAEINLLVQAQQAGAPEQLLKQRVGIPAAVLIARLSQRLEDEHFTSPAAARWAVETWALALGIEVTVDRRISPIDGKAQVWISAGEFLYGDDKRTLTLPGFWIDVTPITQAEYLRFIQANPNYPVPYFDATWSQPYNWDRRARIPPPSKADHPVVLVSWYDAMAYAKWAGKQLLTEEEWEKAARGTDGRAYPWGEDFDKEKCNTSESGIGDTTPVGRYSPWGDSPYGCVDMAGNVWEWTACDWSKIHTNKVLRGGSWYGSVSYARAADRRHDADHPYGPHIGFRCGLG